MTRFALRIRQGFEYAGDIITLARNRSTRAAAARLRDELTMGAHMDIIALNDAGQPLHELVTTLDGHTPRHFCIHCTATSHGIHKPAPPCPGTPT